MNSRRFVSFVALTCSLAALPLAAADKSVPGLRPINQDESKVPVYSLPDPLVMTDGRKVTSAKTWTQKRRPEIFKLFETEMYGCSPGRPADMQFVVVEEDKTALGGVATRKQVRIELTRNQNGPAINLLLYIPNGTKTPPPVFVGLNFNGNQSVHSDPGIRPSLLWTRPGKSGSLIHFQAPEGSRGSDSNSWCVEAILSRGYALATCYYGDIEPDGAEGWQYGVRAALSKSGANTVFQPDQWGAISAWAWGLSRVMDFIMSDANVDSSRVALMGHSRLGKTALWAGASDPRFAIVISNESGEGGAALARRQFGETTAVMNRNFPHWCCGNFKKYNDREDSLPMDQHELIALMAPRPVYVASAVGDVWSDPKGEFLAALNAEPVYRLFGLNGLGVKEMPALDQPVGDFIGYHVRTGKHDVLAYDWEQYLRFADRHFKK